MFPLKTIVSAKLSYLDKEILKNWNICIASNEEICCYNGGCKNYYDAAKNGHLKCLKSLYINGLKFDQFTTIDKFACSYVSGNGNLKFLKYLINNGCPYDIESCNSAALNGQLKCLKYLIKNNCQFNNYTLRYCIIKNNLDCLKFLHSNGGSFDKECYIYAARNKSIEILKYLYSNGCEFNKECFHSAILSGNLECLKYLCKNVQIPDSYEEIIPNCKDYEIYNEMKKWDGSIDNLIEEQEKCITYLFSL